MGKWSKLYGRLVGNGPPPRLSFREFIGLVEAAGFVKKRQRGSHTSYRHPSVPEVLTVQHNGKEAQPYQVRAFLDMMRRHDLSVED